MVYRLTPELLILSIKEVRARTNKQHKQHIHHTPEVQNKKPQVEKNTESQANQTQNKMRNPSFFQPLIFYHVPKNTPINQTKTYFFLTKKRKKKCKKNITHRGLPAAPTGRFHIRVPSLARVWRIFRPMCARSCLADATPFLPALPGNFLAHVPHHGRQALFRAPHDGRSTHAGKCQTEIIRPAGRLRPYRHPKQPAREN